MHGTCGKEQLCNPPSAHIDDWLLTSTSSSPEIILQTQRSYRQNTEAGASCIDHHKNIHDYIFMFLIIRTFIFTFVSIFMFVSILIIYQVGFLDAGVRLTREFFYVCGMQMMVPGYFIVWETSVDLSKFLKCCTNAEARAATPASFWLCTASPPPLAHVSTTFFFPRCLSTLQTADACTPTTSAKQRWQRCLTDFSRFAAAQVTASVHYTDQKSLRSYASRVLCDNLLLR